MTIFRCILPQWAVEKYPNRKRVVEGQFTEEQLIDLNEQFYNIYYLPNYPSVYDSNKKVDGSQIDTFEYIFVDMDLKDGLYKTKENFIEIMINNRDFLPTKIIDSGNGVHIYWKVNNLDAMTYLKFQRRLIQFYRTDEAVGQIFQLMRYPGFVNTKKEHDFGLCKIIYEGQSFYTSEEVNKFLPPLTEEDRQYCEQHYNRTYSIEQKNTEIQDKIPLRFMNLLKNSPEVKNLWLSQTDDRSKTDFRLAHVMFANGLSKEEATSVLVNSHKALERSPAHRLSYATNIVDKIWTFETTDDKNTLDLSMSVKDILERRGDALKGTRFACHRYIDATAHGFRLGQVIGLVAGSGVGKTAVALNMFMGFVQNNPDYDHFFIPLEQPANEIADRWKQMCGDNISLYNKVHIISNYNEDGSFRHLSLTEIKDYLLRFQQTTDKKVGCVVIDHIGALKKKGKHGENQDLMDICHSMKSFAIETNTMLIMQSQAPRQKAGIGDIELDKDAAYGTVYFESFVDYLITIWQPLKRCYAENGCPTTTAFKFCKIRHKDVLNDEIQEDIPYKLYFDTNTKHLRQLTETEEKSFDFFNRMATNKRKLDKRTDITTYKSVGWI